MFTLVLIVFGFVLIACIALLFLASIAVGKLSHGWFLGWADKSIRSSDEVFANDVVEPAIPVPRATVPEEVLMFYRPSNQSHENVDLLRLEIDHRDTCRFAAVARDSSFTSFDAIEQHVDRTTGSA
jgi:hypothetical protein